MVFAILSMVVPFAALLAGVYLEPKTDENPAGASLAPGLALDLQGGTQIILTPVSTDGSEITPESIDESINVIRQRIDSSGVAEAEITSQGGTNIVVAIPGEPDEATLDLVRQSAQMLFRPVIAMTAPGPFEDTVPEEREQIEQLGVMGYPTLAVIRDGRVVGRLTGAYPADALLAWLREHVPESGAARADGVARADQAG